MSIKQTITDIVTQLSNWKSTGLNTAQTSQAIVLRILASLGYDIFNPLEVFAQQNSAEGSNSYTPDFTIIFNSHTCFIIGVKPLGKTINNTHRSQTLNYINSIGLRWAILTNGINWLFFDNQLPEAEKLATTLDITDIQIATYLEELLLSEVWKQSNADKRIEQTIELIKVESKLRQMMRRGFSKDEYGLQFAIEFKLNPKERQLAESHFEILLERMFFLPCRETQPDSHIRVMLDESNAFQWLAEHIEQSSVEYSTIRKNIFLKINGMQVEVKNWQDIYHGIVQTLLFVNKEKEISFLFKHAAKLKNSHDKKQYRPLNNQKYLRVGLKIKDIQEIINQLLQLLPISKGSIEIMQQGKLYHFPY
jgi:hypothetical protein